MDNNPSVEVTTPTGAKVTLTEGDDGSLMVLVDNYLTLTVRPEARNSVSLGFPMPEQVQT